MGFWFSKLDFRTKFIIWQRNAIHVDREIQNFTSNVSSLDNWLNRNIHRLIEWITKYKLYPGVIQPLIVESFRQASCQVTTAFPASVHDYTFWILKNIVIENTEASVPLYLYRKSLIMHHIRPTFHGICTDILLLGLVTLCRLRKDTYSKMVA